MSQTSRRPETQLGHSPQAGQEMITRSPGLTYVNAGACLFHHPGALVPEDRRHRHHVLHVHVGVADSRGLDPDQDLAGPQIVQLHGLQNELPAGYPHDGGG